MEACCSIGDETANGIPYSDLNQRNMKLKIPQATKQGYIEVEEGGVFDAAYPESKTRCGRVQGGGRYAQPIMCSSELLLFEGVEDEQEDIRSIRGVQPRFRMETL